MKHWIAAGLALAALTVSPAGAQDASSLPTITTNYTSRPPRLDGKLQDPAWLEAAPFTLAQTYDGQPVQGGAVVRSAWDQNNLYFAFDVPDPVIIADRLGRDGLIFERDDVMELFFWPNENLPYYYEVVVNPRGTVYDAFLVAQPALDGPSLTLPDWNPDIRTSGTLKPILYRPDRPGAPDPEGRWIIEMAIPLRAFSSRGMSVPTNGEAWRLQVNRFNRPDPTPGALDATALAPYDRLGWPHVLNRFGRLAFTGSAPSPAPVIAPVIPESGAATAVPTTSGTAPIVLPPVTVTPTETKPAEPTTPPVEPVTPPVEPTTPPSEPTTPPSGPTTPPAEPVTPPAEPVTPPSEPVTPPAETARPTTPVDPATYKVSLNFEGTPLKDALETLFKGTGLNYIVAVGVLEDAPSVTIKVENAPFESALRILTRTAGLDVRRVDGVYHIGPADAP